MVYSLYFGGSRNLEVLCGRTGLKTGCSPPPPLLLSSLLRPFTRSHVVQKKHYHRKEILSRLPTTFSVVATGTTKPGLKVPVATTRTKESAM